jgi:hypothetical protein
MIEALLQYRRRCSGSALFCAALAVGFALYAWQVLAKWVHKTESDLVVVCLVGQVQAAERARLLADLKADPLVREARLVEPREVAAWVSRAVSEVETTVTLPATQMPSAIELKCNGVIREPRRFAQTLDAIRSNPACRRVFFDAASQQHAAGFYSSARWIVRALLLIALIGVLAAGFSSPRVQEVRPVPIVALVGTSPTLVTADREKRGLAVVAEIARAVSPSIVAWVLLFAILKIWPMPSPDGLPLATHLLVFAATVGLVELPCRLAAAIRRALG